MFRRIQLSVLIFIVCTFFISCSVPQKQIVKNNKLSAELLVTRDFCNSIVADKKTDSTVGDKISNLLKSNLNLETQYEGAFIKSINNISSEKRNGINFDWFYYVNGIAPDSSIKEIEVNSNDKVFLDYHPWTMDTFIPAIIGAYPEPFVNGFKGQTNNVKIFHTNNSKACAEKLALSLRNNRAKSISIQNIPDNFNIAQDNPSIVLGTWKELKTQKNIKDLCSRNVKSGIFAVFDVDMFKLLNFKGEPIKTYNKDISVITAAASGFGNPNPLWIITSIEQSSLEKAVDMLAKKPEKIRGLYSAAITGGEIIKLPAVK